MRHCVGIARDAKPGSIVIGQKFWLAPNLHASWRNTARLGASRRVRKKWSRQRPKL